MKKVILVLAMSLAGLTSCAKKKDCWWNVDNTYTKGWVIHTEWEDVPKKERESYFSRDIHCIAECQPHSYCIDAEIRVRP